MPAIDDNNERAAVIWCLEKAEVEDKELRLRRIYAKVNVYIN